MWEEISKAEHFERSLLEFPGAFPVFFANDEPGAAGVRDGGRGHLRSRLREFKEVLEEAPVVLVIGRASAVGNTEDNRALAGRRAVLIAGLVDELRGEGVEHQAVAWGLADTLTFSVNLLQPFFANNPIASRERDEEGLKEMAADPSRVAERSDAANRMALVVPLPCEGSEFFPEPSYPLGQELQRYD